MHVSDKSPIIVILAVFALVKMLSGLIPVGVLVEGLKIVRVGLN